MRARRWFTTLAFSGPCLVGCTDGELHVLERSSDAGRAGTASSAGQPGGGSGGSAGMVPVSPFVLDDFEDGDTQSFIPGGYWYFEPDPTCTGYFGIEFVAARAGSARAIRARGGGGCTAWGALLGLDLRGTAQFFDTSSFHELRLWARAEPGSVMDLSVAMLERAHFHSAIQVTSEWREIVLPLDGFVFDDMGEAHALDRRAVQHLQVFVFSPEPFDFWLDDLAFVRSR